MKTQNQNGTILLTTLSMLAVVASLSSRVQEGTGSLTQPTTPTQSATPTPQTIVDSVKCPHPSQNLITPMGQSDPVCVYRRGSVGQKLREAGNDQYHDLRRSLKKDGQSLQEIEDELYQVDQQLIEKLQGQYGEI